MQVRKIADQSYEVALKHIRDNREAIDYIVDELVERETITGEVRQSASSCRGLLT